MHISALYIYPVKSLGGIELPYASVTRRGLQYDRRWMITDKKGMFLTQWQFPEMALMKTSLHNNDLIITYKKHSLVLPLELSCLLYTSPSPRD